MTQEEHPTVPPLEAPRGVAAIAPPSRSARWAFLAILLALAAGGVTAVVVMSYTIDAYFEGFEARRDHGDEPQF
jgi:hypothetical protein